MLALKDSYAYCIIDLLLDYSTNINDLYCLLFRNPFTPLLLNEKRSYQYVDMFRVLLVQEVLYSFAIYSWEELIKAAKLSIVIVVLLSITIFMQYSCSIFIRLHLEMAVDI